VADEHASCVHDEKSTWFGDADLDREFSASDLISVLAAGQYDDAAVLSLQSRRE
jgi:hypothetical protein